MFPIKLAGYEQAGSAARPQRNDRSDPGVQHPLCGSCSVRARQGVAGAQFRRSRRRGVGEDEELSHDRHDRDLGGFSGFDHGFGFGLEFRVQSDGVEGRACREPVWLVETAPAADGSLSMGLAAVPRDRRQTYEASAAWACSETPEHRRRLDDEHVCGHLADAWECSSRCRTAGTGPSLRCAAF